MGSSSGAAAVLVCVVLSLVAAASAEPEPKFISMAALKGTEAPSSSRKLISFGRGFCPVPFDEMRKMGKIGNKCRGQEIPRPQCCAAFKEFACPYSDLLDELTNGCNVLLLDKIQTFCSVPMGYFAFCGDSDVGITCPVH